MLSSLLSQKTLKAIAVALNCPLRLYDKPLVLEIPQQVLGNGEIKVVLTQKLHSYKIAYIVLEVAIHTTWGEKEI